MVLGISRWSNYSRGLVMWMGTAALTGASSWHTWVPRSEKSKSTTGKEMTRTASGGTLPRRGVWDWQVPVMAIRMKTRMPANRGMTCARRNSRRRFRLGVTHSLGRHERRQSTNKKGTLSTHGSDQGKSLWGHYCGKSVAMSKTTYEAAHEDKACFDVRRFEFEQWDPSRGSAQWIFLRDKE